jgi:lysyl endopeptidase
VNALAPAAHTTVEVPIAIATNASCGAPLALDYIGSAAPSSFSLDTRAVLGTTVGGGGSCQTSNACPVAIPAIATRPGFYFSGARSGNGLANFVYGEVYGGVWYSALPDRSPTWYILNGDYKDHLGVMPILRFRNSAAPGGFAPLSDAVGRAWVAQIDADSLMYAWTIDGGKSGAELLDATPLPFTNPNHSQTWYATSESGWGLSIESLLLAPNSFLEFIVGYIYDGAGTARWVLGTSDSITGGALNVSTYAPHCPACPRFNDWEAASQRAAGSMSRTYTGPVGATFNSTITLPAPLSGSWNRTNLPLTTIGPPAQQP